MKIYKAKYYDEHYGRILAWFTSRKEAERYLSKAVGKQPKDHQLGLHRYYRHSGEVEVCQFPATREGIVGWLSTEDFAQTDNG